MTYDNKYMIYDISNNLWGDKTTWKHISAEVHMYMHTYTHTQSVWSGQ